jgi:hypothetical protein
MSWLALLIVLALSGCGVATNAAVASLGGASHQRTGAAASPVAATHAASTPVALPTPDAGAALVALGTPFQLSADQPRAVLTEAGLTVQFERVLEDSRCPEGARCMWAGRALAQLTVSDGAGQQSFEVVLNGVNRLDDPAAAAFGPYLISLVDLTPYPEVGAQLAAPTVTLLVEHRP